MIKLRLRTHAAVLMQILLHVEFDKFWYLDRTICCGYKNKNKNHGSPVLFIFNSHLNNKHISAQEQSTNKVIA